MTNTRRTQDQRSNTTQALLLESAAKLFGTQGYANTSLEDIAVHCKLTIGAIYHHFGNKKKLFEAVNDMMEQRIVNSIEQHDASTNIETLLLRWQSFLELCRDPGFRRIVLLDSPTILGRDRWASSPVTIKALQVAKASRVEESFTDYPKEDAEKPGENYHQQLIVRMLMGAFAEAGLLIAEAKDPEAARLAAEKLVRDFVAKVL